MIRFKYILLALLLAFMPAAVVSCGGGSDDEPGTGTGGSSSTGEFDVDITLPASIVATKGGDITLKVNNSKAPLTSDKVLLENTSGVSSMATIKSASAESFTFTLSQSFKAGSYRFYLLRGDRRKNFGTTSIQIVDKIIEPSEGTTVYGVVKTPDGTGLKDVQVSDGVEIVVTDAEGVYQLKSRKELGYVFVTLPSGYEAQSEGVLPCIHGATRLDANLAERIDFTLNKVENQGNYKVIFFGDMHLADRTSDRSQFTKFMADVNNYRAAHATEKFYAITLGDMTWDLYWYSRNYKFAEYLRDMNDLVAGGMQVFHTMGNHDNDYKALNNMDAKSLYRTTISPNYYSFNIGKIHYIVLDDIDCSSYDGTTSRNYAELVTNDQLAWLAKDLSYVSKSTPVIVTMHAPLYGPNGVTAFRKKLANADVLLGILAGYKVHFVTGHIHKNYNVTPVNNLGAGDVYEHNVAAVCSDWWWSGHITPGCLVSCDGSPSGYAVWDFKGEEMSYMYKAARFDENFQFRTYDLNNVTFSSEGMSEKSKAKLAQLTALYTGVQDNRVLINVWNYNPSWSVTVTTETGQSLAVTPTMAYDPLHIAAQAVQRLIDNTAGNPNFLTSNYPHFFMVNAPDADTDLTIKVCDEFGHVWTENMARPKAFSTSVYAAKQ